jgi:hypothetical protein
MGNPWEGIAEAMGVRRQNLYNHLNKAGLSSARRLFTDISDDDLDKCVAEILIKHPLAGSAIVMGYLEAKGIHLPSERVQDSPKTASGVSMELR